MASRRETAGTQSQEVKAPQAPCPSGHRRFVQLILQGERMMKRSTKFLAILLSLVMVLALLPAGIMAESNSPTDTDSTAWQVSKSKTATALDKNDETTVTLSLPQRRV
jgi:hypothetical protein